MKHLRLVISSVLLIALTAITSFAPLGSAAINNGGNGMKVSPVRTDLTLKPGASKDVTVYVQNITGADATLSVIVNDFVAKDETGAPSLLLNGEANPRHGLKKYMSAPKTVNIPKGKQEGVRVTISIPKDAAGGGYYGAVRFAPAGSDDEGKNVSLSGSVGSLILVNVPGDIKEDVQIASFDARRNDSASVIFTSNKNLQGVVRVRNSGNVQEQPFGRIVLKKGDKVLGSYEINNTDPRGNVLPDSIRKFSVDLKNVGSFGKYTLQGNFGYGSSGQLLSASTSFYIVPVWMIIIVLLLLALVLFLIFGLPKAVRRYNQNILRRAGRR
jgi:hypothetical protein